MQELEAPATWPELPVPEARFAREASFSDRQPAAHRRTVHRLPFVSERFGGRGEAQRLDDDRLIDLLRQGGASFIEAKSASRASNDSRSTLHRPPSRLNKGAQAFR